MEQLVSLLGLASFLLLAFYCSENRRQIQWRTILLAQFIQAFIAAWVLGHPSGQHALAWLTTQVENLIEAGRSGISFLFGELAVRSGSLGFVFAFQVLPVIIFFSSLLAVLYHLKIMGFVIRVIGGGLQRILGTTKAESFSAAANIFVGQTEAPLVIKPYLARLSRSELFAVMVGGLASVAGSILAGYAGLGVRMDHLLAACFMAAPAGLLYAKILIPQSEECVDAQGEQTHSIEESRPVNVLDAAALGASEGLKLALNVGAMLLAFIGLIAVLNLFLGSIGGWFHFPQLSLQWILGWAFTPVAWLLGIPPSELQAAGSCIGQKIIVNEFVAYDYLKEIRETLSERSLGIITFALCGFANLSSIAILLGGLGGLIPKRRPEIAQLGLKAVFAATLANLSSACLAGLFL